MQNVASVNKLRMYSVYHTTRQKKNKKKAPKAPFLLLWMFGQDRQSFFFPLCLLCNIRKLFPIVCKDRSSLDGWYISELFSKRRKRSGLAVVLYFILFCVHDRHPDWIVVDKHKFCTDWYAAFLEVDCRSLFSSAAAWTMRLLSCAVYYVFALHRSHALQFVSAAWYDGDGLKQSISLFCRHGEKFPVLGKTQLWVQCVD